MAEEPMVSPDAPVDVTELMAGIRARLRERGQGGPRSDEEIEALTEARLREICEEVEIDPELRARLLGRDQGWNIAPDYPILTHRKGPLAWLLVGLKTLVRPFVRLYTDQPLSRQAQINQHLHHLCHSLVREVVRLRIENAAAAARRPDALPPEGGPRGG